MFCISLVGLYKQLLCLCFCQNLIVILTILLAFLIPDTPKDVREHAGMEQIIINETIFQMEINRRNGIDELSEADRVKIRRQARNVALRRDIDSVIQAQPSTEYPLVTQQTFQPAHVDTDTIDSVVTN